MPRYYEADEEEESAAETIGKHYLRRANPLTNPLSTGEDLLIAAGVLGVAGWIGYVVYKKYYSASATATSTGTVTLSPGALSVTGMAGKTMTIVPPAGGSLSTVQQGTNTPVAAAGASFSTVAAVGNYAVAWIDSTNTAQTTTITVSS